MIKSFLARSLFGLTLAALASSAALAGEAEIRKSIEALYPSVKVDAVAKTEMPGIYEVRIGSEIIYTDANGKFVIVGDIIDAKGRRNITEDRKAKLAQIKFSDLPLDMAVKTVRGNGKRVFATFEDPNCVYCKKLQQEMAGVTNVTIYTFLYPILAADSADKAKAIWCSPDRSKAWADWMQHGNMPKAAQCADPIDKIVALGKKLGVRGTPTIFFADGNRIPSYIPVAKLEEVLNQVDSQAK